MTRKFLLRLGALALLAGAATASAAECTASTPTCDFYLNHHGDLMRAAAKGAPPITLFAGTGAEATPFSQYVMLRSDRYYLVREKAGSAKSFDIVPLDVNDRTVGFNRILHFSLAPEKSAGVVGAWAADEIDLAGSDAIESFSWDRIDQLLGKIQQPTEGETGNALQDGFSAIPLAIHDSTGAATGQRAYLYADKLGATPDSIVCIAGCVVDTSSPTGIFRGGIGPYPIALTLATQQGRIEGSYRYVGKKGMLKLSGATQGSGVIAMVEHPAAQPTREAGRVDAILDHGLYMGLWTSPSKGKQLPFFAVMDSL
ncbi:MAG TPA: hypothetical protein VL635_01935 [Trinickia sp.]|nr:hypothetical protein [Trinickia sp.]